MSAALDQQELELLLTLDQRVGDPRAREVIDALIPVAERALALDSETPLAWEPVPLSAYAPLPRSIRSSWVFILRAGTATGAERHPNSHQRAMAYRGTGDLQTFADGGWRSNVLSSEPGPIERRWASIPPLVWHQAVVQAQHWIVVSFHTAEPEALIERRADPADARLSRQRIYWDQPKPAS